MTSAATFEFIATDESQTARLGQALAGALTGGGVVALHGPLGAGKTRLVQAIAEALGVDRRDVVSPTFVLVHEYQGGRLPIIHIDAYRMADEDEFAQLGGEEYFVAPNLVLIEWAERIERCLPAERLDVSIEPQGEQTRRFTLSGAGQRYTQAIEHARAGSERNS